MRNLFFKIEEILPEGGSWCDLTKASTLAALVVATRPSLVIELGVWQGGSLVPMLLALQHNKFGRAIAIDAWSTTASVEGESGANASWWSTVDHDAAYAIFMARLEKHNLGSICEVVRSRSDAAPIPSEIDVLHVDANHREQAMRDVERFGSRVRTGGFMILDDTHWEGGHVTRAREHALETGFVERYPLGMGIVMQRISSPAST